MNEPAEADGSQTRRENDPTATNEPEKKKGSERQEKSLLTHRYAFLCQLVEFVHRRIPPHEDADYAIDFISGRRVVAVVAVAMGMCVAASDTVVRHSSTR